MASQPPASPFLAGPFAPVPDEITAADLPVTGRLPPGLAGTYYRNGPNPQFQPVPPYHLFSGDGMIHAVTLGPDGAAYRNRWVRTPRFEAERAAGAPLFQGFGRPLRPAAPGGEGSLDTGVANTSVISHAGMLLALEEAHPPTALDPETLATRGYWDGGGALRPRMTAHPKPDPETGALVFFAYSVGGPLVRGMRWGEIDAAGRVVRHEDFEAPYCAMVHDFAVTAGHVVFPVLPLTGDMNRAMQGGPAFAWEPAKGGFLGVLRRSEGVASLRWVEVEPRYVFHLMNAFDEGEDIVLDVVEYDSAPLFPRADGGPPGPATGRLARWRITPGGMVRVVLDAAGGEFPRIDDRRAGLPYARGFQLNGEGSAILVQDLAAGTRAAWTPPMGGRPGEPVFVPAAPDAPEGEGWLLSLIWRPATDDSVLAVLDAETIAAGPVAEVVLPRRVPFGFHGSWRPA